MLRKTGIDLLGDVAWGTHFCLFYQTNKDLIDILVPYFKAGLENNEFCMWVTCEPLKAKEAKASLKKRVKDLDNYIRKGQIEIIDYGQWYTKSGKFETDRVLQGWVQKHDDAIARGFDGLRLTGNTFWLEKKDWKEFGKYEESVNNIIDKYRMLAICTYSLDKCGASEVIDVVNNHQYAIVKRKGLWDILESAERKKVEEALRESEERYRDLFENAGEGIITLDLDGRITEANRLVEEYGFNRDELIGKRLFDFVPEYDKARSVSDFQSLTLGSRVQGHMDVITPKGIIAVEYRDTPIASAGEVIGVQAILTDITERKRVEEEIRKKNEMLEAFLYMVSHDLKNPVISLQGFCSLLLKDHRIDLNEKALFYVERISANAKLIAGMLEDVLELAQIGSLKEEKAEISAQKIIESVWVNLSSCFRIKDVELIVPESLPKVFYSEKRLYQIFDNLLSNALRFKSESRALRLEIGYEDNGDHYIFLVQDNGIGIEQKYHDKIFDVFSKLEESKSEGTGVGLAIVKRIAETNHGRVWVESRVGVGSTFYFTIPKKL